MFRRSLFIAPLLALIPTTSYALSDPSYEHKKLIVNNILETIKKVVEYNDFEPTGDGLIEVNIKSLCEIALRNHIGGSVASISYSNWKCTKTNICHMAIDVAFDDLSSVEFIIEIGTDNKVSIVISEPFLKAETYDPKSAEWTY